MLGITTSIFFDSIFGVCVIENGKYQILVNSWPLQPKKNNEMKNDFLYITRPFLGKNADVSGFLAGHIPYSLSPKDAKF